MTDQPTNEVKVTLHIEGERRIKVPFKISERAIVGRTDEDSTTNLGLDLAPYGGANVGVSRMHAVFSCRDGAIYLEDLESTNGTRINGMTLIPNQPYLLRDGDELEFGSARLTLKIK